MKRRKIWGSGFAAAAVMLVLASTAYACVLAKGTATVTGSVRASNTMTGSGTSHAYCTGGGPTTSAAGPASSTVSASFAASTTGCVYQLSQGTYDVKLRNTPAAPATPNGYKGSDGSSWTLGASMGCFSGATGGTMYTLSPPTMTVNASGTGSGSWTVPSGATSNGTTDASVFCVKNQANSDGFLAPFRVSTV